MYDQARADWWISRSQSPEYQAAYGKIADSFVPGGFHVDVCCGNGEFLKHLIERYPTRAYVGVDSCPQMIEACASNLDEMGISVRVYIDDFAGAQIKSGEVALVQFDVLGEQPFIQHQAHSTSSIFADLPLSWQPHKFAETCFETNSYFYPDDLTGMELLVSKQSLWFMRHVNFIMNGSGRLLEVNYESGGGMLGEIDYKGKSQFMALVNCWGINQTTFVEDRKVGIDGFNLDNQEMVASLTENEILGYHINEFFQTNSLGYIWNRLSRIVCRR